LYYTEPANFIVYSALQTGVLKDICQNVDLNWFEVSNSLMLFLCHLFCRVPLHRRLQTAILSSEMKAKFSPSKVVLESLPKAHSYAMKEHNKQVLAVFEMYIIHFCKQSGKKLGRDIILPLSKISFHGNYSDNNSNLYKAMNHQRILVNARSPFVALSGLGDQFSSVEDLIGSIRNGIYLDWSALPVIRTEGDNSQEIILNAYIMDFFCHGSLKALYRSNQIRPGDAWQLLKDFSLILKTITVALEKLTVLDRGLDRCCRALRMLTNEFTEKLQSKAA
jgi:hypothetical protein